MRYPYLLIAWLLLASLLFAGCKQSPQQPETVPQPAAPSARANGERLYLATCARCHRTQGEGLPGVAPPLKGNPVVTAHDPAELIRTLLYGVGGKTIEGVEYPGRMPGLAEILSDEEIAQVANYTRSAWDHKAPPVAPTAIQKERGKP